MIAHRENAADLQIRQIGIALAAYQPDPTLLAIQLQSIQRQTFQNWICVITVDSSLQPLTRAASLQPYFEDPRFCWSENPQRLGHKKNFERAIKTLCAMPVDAIACSDQDDEWHPEKLDLLRLELQKHGALSLVHSNMNTLRANGQRGDSVWAIERRRTVNNKTRDLLLRNVVTGCAMLMDANLARTYPDIPESAQYHDHWYALLASQHRGVHAVDRVLSAYRQHDQNVVGLKEFHALSAIQIKSPIRNWSSNCIRGWNHTENLVNSLIQVDAKFGVADRLLFIKRDFGIGLMFYGMTQLWGDPVLARTCATRGMGKALVNAASLFSFKNRARSPQVSHH